MFILGVGDPSRSHCCVAPSHATCYCLSRADQSLLLELLCSLCSLGQVLEPDHPFQGNPLVSRYHFKSVNNGLLLLSRIAPA